MFRLKILKHVKHNIFCDICYIQNFLMIYPYRNVIFKCDVCQAVTVKVRIFSVV
jgi:hypothetical protein